MRLSLSQVVFGVNCVVKTVRVIEQRANNSGNHRKNMTLRHLLHVDSFGCLSNHGFNAFNSDAKERIDQLRFYWAQLQHSEERIARGVTKPFSTQVFKKKRRRSACMWACREEQAWRVSVLLCVCVCCCVLLCCCVLCCVLCVVVCCCVVVVVCCVLCGCVLCGSCCVLLCVVVCCGVLLCVVMCCVLCVVC